MAETNDNFALGYTMGQNNGGFGGCGSEWVWIIVLFALWQNGGWGFGGANGNGAAQNYVLASDFATIQRQLSDGFGGVEKGLDTIRNGLCDGFYTEAQLVNGVNMNIMQQGYNTQMGFNAVTGAIKDCCCNNEKAIMGVNYNMATQNCATLQAIDKLGDRIIAKMDNDRTQALRDQVYDYKMKDFGNYIVGSVRETPHPAYVVPNPYCCCGNGNAYGTI